MNGSVIFSDKHIIYELPGESPNDFRLRRLGNEKILGKSQYFLDILFFKTSDGQAIVKSILLTCQTSTLI